MEGSDNTYLGDVLKDKIWLNEAEQVYRNCLRLNPDDAYLNKQYSEVLWDLGKPAESSARLRLAAQVYLRLGSVSEDSEKVFQTLLDNDHRNYVSPEFREVCGKELSYIRQTQ